MPVVKPSKSIKSIKTNKQSKSNDSELDTEEDTYSSYESENDNSNENTSETKKRHIMRSSKLPLKEALKTVEERSLYTKVDRFFSTCTTEQIQTMVDIINNEASISLRLLNWFAMKYSAQMEAIDVVEDGKVKLFDVKISYRARLDTHSKKYFDPFRRGAKFDYNYDKTDKSKVVETTLCQLNFFRWMFMHNLVDFVEENFEMLRNKMGSFNTLEKKKKETKKENEKKLELKNKSKDVKIKVSRFIDQDTSKVVIII